MARYRIMARTIAGHVRCRYSVTGRRPGQILRTFAKAKASTDLYNRLQLLQQHPATGDWHVISEWWPTFDDSTVSDLPLFARLGK